MNTRIPRALLIAAGLSLFAAACGDSDTTTSSPSNDDTAESTEMDDAGTDEMDMDDGGSADHDHDDGATAETKEAAEPHPAVAVEIVADPDGGWTVHSTLSNFRLTSLAEAGEHVDGEGHLHVYIDGKTITMLEETSYKLPGLSAGMHEIRVELSSIDHSTLVIDGVPIDASVMLEVGEGEATATDDMAMADDSHDHSDHDDHTTDDEMDHDHEMTGEPTRFDADINDAAQTITIELIDGKPVGGSERVEVDAGSVVAILVTADGAAGDTVHVHGYDILRDVSGDSPAHFAFNTEIPGVFEVELEGSGQLLVQLEIS